MKGLKTLLSDMYPNQEWVMHPGEGVTQAPISTVVPQKLLEEMLWFFRVEDGKWQGAGVCVGVLSTQNTNSGHWLRSPQGPCPTAGCTFPSEQGPRPRVSVPRRVWLTLTVLISGLGHSFTHHPSDQPQIFKFLLSPRHCFPHRGYSSE